MKKIVSLLLAFAMLFAMTASLAEGTVNITAFQYELENQNIDFQNLWFFQQLEEQTGVHVDFRRVKDADWQTQLNLMFASNDLDDVIIRGGVDIEEYGVTQGLLIPLDEYINEEIMPNYASRLNINNAGDSIPASDGKSYYIGYLIAQNVNHQGTWYINQTWLDELGMEVPTTIDELTEVLRAFKANNMGGENTIPFSASTFNPNAPETVWNQFASFGVPEIGYYYAVNENDEVYFTPAADGWRECAEWLHLLYSEGLMDIETLTQDSNLWANKVNAEQVGFFCYLRLINTALQPDVYANFHSILPPVAEGHKAAVSQILEVPEQGARLTVTNKHPVETLKWIDAQLETETMMVAANGRVGEQIILNDEGKYEVINVPENDGLYNFVPVTCGQFFAPGEYYSAIYQMAPHRVERYEDSQWYAEAGVLEPKSFQYVRDLNGLTADESIEASNIFTELDTFVKESLTTFIRDGVTDASFEQFLNTAKAIGSDRYIELYQIGYDRYLEK